MASFILEIFTGFREVATTAARGINDMAAKQEATVAVAGVLVDGAPGVIDAVSMIKTPPLDERESIALLEGFLGWGTKYAFENLARAQDNDAFPRLVEQLQVRVQGYSE